MNGVVFLRAVRDDWPRLMWWSVGLGAWTLVVVLLYPTLKGIEGFQQLIDNYPPFLRAFMGPITDLTTLEGFLSIEFFAWAPLLFAVYCILGGVRAVRGEERQGSMDLLMGTPVARWQVVVERYLALMLGLVVLAAASLGGILIGVVATGASDADLGRIVAATVNIVPITAVIAALALLCSSSLRRRFPPGPVVSAIVVASYLVDGLAEISERIAIVRPFSMFHYYSGLVLWDGLVARDVAVLAVTAIALVMLAVLAFQRRDIAA